MMVPRKNDWILRHDSEVKGVLERCVHLACNILGYDINQEAQVLNGLLYDRIYFNGYYTAQQEELKRNETKPKKAKK